MTIPLLAMDLISTHKSCRTYDEIFYQRGLCFNSFDDCAKKQDPSVACYNNLETCGDSLSPLLDQQYDYHEMLYTPRIFGHYGVCNTGPQLIMLSILVLALILLFFLMENIRSNILHIHHFYKYFCFPALRILTIDEEQNINHCLQQLDIGSLLIDDQSKDIIMRADKIKQALITARDNLAVHVTLLSEQRSRQSSLFHFFAQGEGAAMDILRDHILFPHLKIPDLKPPI